MCYYNGVKVTLSEYIRLKQIEKQLRGLQLKTKINKGFDYNDWPIIKPNSRERRMISALNWHNGDFCQTWCITKGVLQHSVPKELHLTHKAKTFLLVSREEDPCGKRQREKADAWSYHQDLYEYRHLFLKNKKTGVIRKTATTFPYWISLPDREYFYMAGIYNHWIDQSENFEKDTFAILTTPANSLMEQIHNTKKRMPTILTDDLAYSWLFDDLTDKQIQKIAGHQYPAEEMIAHPISREFMTIENPEAYFEYEDLKEVPLAV